MPIVKPVEEELEQIYLPSTENDPNKENRAWVVLDVSPAMGRDLIEIQSRDSAGMTMMKGLLRRLREWNFYKEDGTAWPIDIDTMQGLLDITDINFLNDKIKASRAAQPLSEPEKKA